MPSYEERMAAACDGNLGPLFSSIPDDSWEEMTSVFSAIPMLGGSYLAIDTILHGLSVLLDQGWMLIPPEFDSLTSAERKQVRAMSQSWRSE